MMKSEYASFIEQTRLIFSNKILRAMNAKNKNQSSYDFLCENWNMKLNRANNNLNRVSTIKNFTTHRVCLNALMNFELFINE